MRILLKNVNGSKGNEYSLSEIRRKTGLEEGHIIEDAVYNPKNKACYFTYKGSDCITYLDSTCVQYIGKEEIKIQLRSYNLTKDENKLANECLTQFLSHMEMIGEQEDGQKFLCLFYKLCAERNYNPNQLTLEI